jgi:hypothetical protein
MRISRDLIFSHVVGVIQPNLNQINVNVKEKEMPYLDKVCNCGNNECLVLSGLAGYTYQGTYKTHHLNTGWRVLGWRTPGEGTPSIYNLLGQAQATPDGYTNQ